MTSREQRRAWVLTRILAGDLTMAAGAEILGLSVRQVWRLRVGYERDGPAALVHANRGRPSARRLGAGVRARIIERRRETLRRDQRQPLLRAPRRARRDRRQPGEPPPDPACRGHPQPAPPAAAAVPQPTATDGRRGTPPPARREPPRLARRSRSVAHPGRVDRRRDRVGPGRRLPRARGCRRLPYDPARHDPKPRGSRVPSTATATARLPRRTRARAPRTEPGSPGSLSQVGRALVELGIGSIVAGSPQAKGRIERLWGTFQDRLVVELRLAGVSDLASANAFLGSYLARHNARFAVPAADPVPAWRPVPDEVRLERILVFKYRRKVARDHTIRLAGQVLQLPREPAPRATPASSSRSTSGSTARSSPSTANAGWSRWRPRRTRASSEPRTPTAPSPASSPHPLRSPGNLRPITLGSGSDPTASSTSSD